MTYSIYTVILRMYKFGTTHLLNWNGCSSSLAPFSWQLCSWPLLSSAAHSVLVAVCPSLFACTVVMVSQPIILLSICVLSVYTYKAQ